MNVARRRLLKIARRSLAAAFAATTLNAADVAPRVFLLDGAVLEENRRRVLAGDETLRAALGKLTRAADKMLSSGPFSVTDKTMPPPSGDKHDYQSMGPYWWPDPKKPDGLPYIRKDGKVNPERRELGDADRYGEMQVAVTTLAVAWYFTGREQYAEHAAKLIRVWYLDPATRMNPNMEYAQAIPGRCEGRGIGIVDASRQPKLIDAVGMLQNSKAWTERDQQGMVEWFSEFLEWLRTSEHGIKESATRNNHATQYDAQVASYALFVGKPEIAEDVLRAVGERRINTQIESDGSQPHELRRTRSWDYSCFNLQHFTNLAELGRKVGIGIWGYEKDGRSILGAIDYLLPYATGKQHWEREQIKTFEPKSLLVPLLQAAKHDDTGRYAEAARALLPEEGLERLLYAKP